MKLTNLNKKHFIQKLLPFISGFLLLFLALSLSLFYIDQQLSTLLIILIIITGLLLFGLTALSFNLKKSSFNLSENKGKHKQTVKFLRVTKWKRFILVVMIFIVSISFIVISHYLTNRLNIRWDVTQAKQHTLSNNSMKFIRSLKSEVKLTAFYVGIPPKYLQDLFKEYQRISAGLITTEIVDPIEQIAYAAKFGNVVSGKERKVIVQSGDNRKEIDFTETFLSEDKLSNAIARVSRSPRQVYFLTGHNEYSIENNENVGLSTFKKILADNNIHSKMLMLGITQSVPDDCDVLIIAGPKNALTLKEEKIISEYLAKGGDALFLIENALASSTENSSTENSSTEPPSTENLLNESLLTETLLTEQQQGKNPALNNILNQWGLNVQSDVVVDLTNHVGDDVGSPATKNYTSHKAITVGLDYTFYVRPRSIRLLEYRHPSIKLASIVSTASSENSWAEKDKTLNIQFDQGIDTAGPIPLAYVVFGENIAKETPEKIPSDTRLIVFTDADFLTNVYINQYSNAQMGLNIVNWLAELDYQTFLSSKEINVERLDLTSKQKRQVISILLLLPFLLVVIGLIVWLRSRFDE